MDFELILVGAFALLALLLLLCVFQLNDRAGTLPARRAFQAMFMLHFMLFCSVLLDFVLGSSLIIEVLMNGSLAGMYTAMALGIMWRSTIDIRARLIFAFSLVYFCVDTVIAGVFGLQIAMTYIVLMNGFCALAVTRRPLGANFADFALALIFIGWALVNVLGLWLSLSAAPGEAGTEGLLLYLLAFSPAFFAGFGVFLVVSYMIDAQDDLTNLSHTDPLTGLYNRRYLNRRAEEIFSHAERRHESVSLIAVDLDKFKVINDRHGHHCGDLTLKMLSEVLERETRTDDTVARIGGDEFIILMQSLGIDEARLLAERIRQKMQTSVLTYKGKPVSCTASFGVTSTETGDSSFEVLMREADRRLYRAKDLGRNRVVGLAGE